MSLGALLRTPGVPGPFVAALIGRLPVTAIGLLLVLHVENLTGSFAAAGASAACFSLGLSASAPVIGRLIDRRGQSAIVLPCGAIVTATLAAIALLPASAPAWAIAALAAASGLVSPPVGSCLRSLWMSTIPADRRHAAFAIDSAATEATYVLGPVVIAGAIGGWSTRAGLGTAAGLLAAGSALYATRASVRAWRPTERHGSLLGPLSSPAVRSLLLMLLCLGTGFGGVEVGVAAVAERAGTDSIAGPLLGAWGLGSIVGAVIVARRPAPSDPARRIVGSLALLAVAHLPLLLFAEPLLLGAALLVAGVTVAPALVAILPLMGEAAPRGTVTEAFTWGTTAIVGGIAAGAATAGVLAGLGHAAPFALAGAAVAAAAAFGALRRPVVAAALASV